MAPSFPSAAKIGDSTAEKIDREQLLAYVRDELICTIGSADAPLTIAVLISTFREDTSDDIGQLATKLGYQSIQHMLSADEFSDIIEPCFTDLAKGAGNKNPEKVFCYKVKSRPDIAHILTSIEEGVRYQNKQASEKNRHLQTLLNDPRNAAKIISGKERLLECLHKLGAEEETVPLLKLQKKYEEEYGTQMAKLELKNFFPTGHLKAIMDEYMFDEVDIFTDKNQNGSLLFKLKKPWEDIHRENIRICEQRDRLKKLEEEKEQRRELDKLRKERKAAAKKEKLAKQAVQQQPKKRVIIPPPEPKKKPEPLIQPMRQQASAFYTDDARLMNRVMSARDPRFTDGDDDEAEEEEKEEEAEESYELCEQAEEGEEQVDFDVEDYEDFLLVEKKDNKPKWTQRDWSCTDTEEGEDDAEAGEGGAQKHNAVGTSSGRAVEEQKTQNSISGQQKKQQEEEEESSEEEEEEDIEEQLKRLQELYGSEKQRNLRIRKAMKKNKRNKMEAELCGRRAREKEMRQQMAEEMLRIFAPNMEGKPTLKVDTKSEDSKLMIAGLLTQFIYGNRELGLSELKDMLQLLFADNYAAVDIHMHAFAKQYMKCARWKELPAEPHLTVKRCAKVLRDKMFHIGKPYRARVMRVHPPNVRVLPSGVRVLAPNPNVVVPKIQHQ